MTHEERAAFINAQAALLNCEVAGMVAENMQREQLGHSMAYTEENFMILHGQYTASIGQDACWQLFRD